MTARRRWALLAWGSCLFGCTPTAPPEAAPKPAPASPPAPAPKPTVPIESPPEPPRPAAPQQLPLPTVMIAVPDAAGAVIDPPDHDLPAEEFRRLSRIIGDDFETRFSFAPGHRKLPPSLRHRVFSLVTTSGVIEVDVTQVLVYQRIDDPSYSYVLDANVASDETLAIPGRWSGPPLRLAEVAPIELGPHDPIRIAVAQLARTALEREADDADLERALLAGWDRLRVTRIASDEPGYPGALYRFDTSSMNEGLADEFADVQLHGLLVERDGALEWARSGLQWSCATPRFSVDLDGDGLRELVVDTSEGDFEFVELWRWDPAQRWYVATTIAGRAC